MKAMIPQDKIKQIHIIWDNYVSSNKRVLDTKGNEYENIDNARVTAIVELRKFIEELRTGTINISEFKTNVDSYNKRNNLWGFTAAKGQMFFNQLLKNSESDMDLSKLLKQCIYLPVDLEDALSKIEVLEKHCLSVFTKAKDKRKAPKSTSVGYFLSYFWQIQDNKKWPIIYTSLINAYKELEIWEDKENQKKAYYFFYELNEQIKHILKDYTGKEITNWDAEHAFWSFKGNPNKAVNTVPIAKKKASELIETEKEKTITVNTSFELSDYLIPKVAKLMELGNTSEKPSAIKGSAYEKLVAEIFKQLDFEVEILGQGSGRNPDAIIKHREENTAFLIDAKAYSDGYSLGIDDRAIKEYINFHCPKLQKEGYKKIGFIIVSNSFKSNFDSFINEITWNTDIKRFILLTSEALLYLLAYKTKDRISPAIIIDTLISLGNPVVTQNIIEKFDDV